MKKIFKYSLMFAAALTLSMGLVSCSDDDEPTTENETPALTDSQRAELRTAATNVQDKLAAALAAISPGMKAPFVQYYNDPSAGDAMDALDELDNALSSLDNLLDEYGQKMESEFAVTNANYVELTVKPTYRALANDAKKLVESLDGECTDAAIASAGANWLAARKQWEFSEAFLFGPAGDYAIDPHIDTWPFNVTMFNNHMSKYNPSVNESDAEILEESIATGQNLTGFHAVEYLIFRNGASRKAADLTADEFWFAKTAAEDLYLSSLKLVSAWGGEVSDDEQEILDDNEFESKDYGVDFKNAGKTGSGYSTVLLATRQIIAGCQDIIGEVRDSKIGAPHTGEDTNYIESPHAYNSIQDFYDNIMSCQHALYGGLGATTPTATSLIGVCLGK